MILPAAITGALLLAGLVMIVAYFRPAPPKPEKHVKTQATLAQRWRKVSRGTRLRLIIGLVIGLLSALITALPLLIIIVPAAVVGLPLLLGKQDTREQQLIIALEAWARSLASTADTGRYTLREVIGITRGATPPVLRGAVDRLHARMSTSWSAAEAFKAFADELDSAYVDEVTVYLIQAAQFNAGGLARALSAVADTLAVQAKQRMEIFNEREKPRRTMQVMTGIVALVLVGLIVFSGTPTIAFYRTPIGQIALLVIVGVFTLILAWAKSQTRFRPESRIVLSKTPMEVER